MKKFLLFAFGCFYLPFVWDGNVYANHLNEVQPICSQMISMIDPFNPSPVWYMGEQNEPTWWYPCHTFAFEW